MFLKSFALFILLLLFACVNNNVDPNSTKHVIDPENSMIDPDSFFPLNVGNSWTYQITETDYDISTDSFRFPKEFTVQVVGKVTINGIEYFAVKNYFFPGPVIPETSYLRIEGDYVYMLVNDVEYLLYSFEKAENKSWHLPMQVNETLVMDYYMSSSHIDASKSEFLWHMGENPGRAESQWTDIFVKGKGRTKIESTSQAYGKTVWELKNQ